MKLVNKKLSNTKASFDVVAEDKDLEKYRQQAASSLKTNVKVPGFRPGKAPTDMILKYADQDSLNREFLNLAVNDLYLESQKTLVERIVGEPEIAVTKFVPFQTLEISVSVPIIKNIKLPDYKNLKLTKNKLAVTKELIDRNLKDLQLRAASLTPVKRAAKNGDLVVIDFEGTDFKTKDKLTPATATNYRLLLGEGTLIPGFEDNLIGLSAGQSKDFDLTFPKDYPDKTFANRKVSFKAKLVEVNSVSLPKLDDNFAKSLGPFKTLNELKTELKKQLESENDRQATIDLENRILNTLAEKTEVEIDGSLVQAELELLLSSAKQSALQRGQTWQEFLAGRGQSEEDYESELTEAAISRIKGGLAIGEIATNESINVSESELNSHIENLKRQYSDPAMRQELDNPANRRELGMRLLTEKVLDYVQKQGVTT